MTTTLLIIVLFCVAMIAGGLVLRSYMTGAPIPGLGQRPEKRLQVLEQSSVDGRRRLILIRRDNVEHLIMTGGPVDLVVETGIGASPARPRAVTSDAERREPVTFGRSQRPAASTASGTATPPAAAAGE
jgi:flagellar protein FliO/FliZ